MGALHRSAGGQLALFAVSLLAVLAAAQAQYSE
jgi:hypothetical protein